MKKKRLLISLVILIVGGGFFWLWLYSNYSPPIFMYHAFDKEKVGTYASVSPETFSKQMAFIRKRGYKVIPLRELCALLKGKKEIPHNLVVITADDGYKDNLKAIEILDEFGYPAIIFLVVNKIGEEDYLNREDIRWFLENTNVSIGSHTLNHAYLPETDKQNLKTEIRNSKVDLEKMFSLSVDVIAYPVGGFDNRVLEEVENAGYLCACATNRGFSSDLDIFALRRIKITERDLGIRLWAKLSGFYNIFRKVKNPY